jgi:F0F1-type ATP synthase epsilon subunit
MKPKFHLQILSLQGLVFDDLVESVYLASEEGEFELLAFHHPLVAALIEGEIKIADYPSVPIKLGAVSFRENRCYMIVEIDPSYKAMKESWDI